MQLVSLPHLKNELMKTFLPLILLLFVLISANQKQQTFSKKQLIGIWLFEENTSSENSASLTKSKKFKEEEPGIQLKKNGKLVKRQNSGKCATPPISFANYEGTWKMTGESTLTVKYEFFDGTIEEDWKIIETNKNKLKIIVLDSRTKSKNTIPQLKN
jgi:hypothetical protein